MLTGPVYTSLSTKRKTYSAKLNTQNQKIVTGDVDANLPVDLPVLLKIYWAPEGRDIYSDPPPIFGTGISVSQRLYNFARRINPVVGFGVTENPFKNLYTGLSFEPVRGVDIIGGFHWSKIKTLANDFQEGQITTIDPLPTKDKFLQGTFVGVALDVGVAATWLTKSALSSFSQ